MKPAPFAYHRPTALHTVIDLLERHGAEARVLAGGQSLMPLLNSRELRPSVVVDVNGVEGLDEVFEVGDRLRVGALVRQNDVIALAAGGLLSAAASYVGHLHTRNRGTVCGSLAHGDPLAELPLALLVAGGSVEIVRASGVREMEAEDFLEQGLGESDLLLASWWPVAAGPVAFEEVSQGGTVCAAAATIDAGILRVGVAGTVDRPRVAVGNDPDAALEELARWEYLADDIAPASYRAAACAELARRCVAEVMAQGAGS